MRTFVLLRRPWLIAVVAVVALAAGACGGGDSDSAAAGDAAGARDASNDEPDPLTILDAASQPRSLTQFVGTVEGTNAYIGIQYGDDENVTVYVCDGEEISDSFGGEVDGGTFEASNYAGAGSAVSGQIDGDVVTGTVTFADGATYDFRAERATVPAGLYQLSYAQGDDVASAATIVLPDGTSRGGKVKVGSAAWCEAQKTKFKNVSSQYLTASASGGDNTQEIDVLASAIVSLFNNYSKYGCVGQTGAIFD